MTGSDLQRLLDYLASDRLGFQYTGNLARHTRLDHHSAESALEALKEKGWVDSMGDGDRRGWQITKDGIVKATSNRIEELG